MGKGVQDAAGDKIGSVKDLVFDGQGNLSAVVLGVGGFLGIGEKSVAISFSSLTPSKDATGNLMLTTSASQDDINSAPDFLSLDQQK